MNKETNITNLDTNLSKEDEDIVDSIINELNNEKPKNQVDPEKQKMMQQQQQQQQQQQHHQRMMQQQQQQQMMMQQQQQQMKQQQPSPQTIEKPSEKDDKDKEDKKDEVSFFDKLKVDFKEPAIVFFLVLIFLMPQSDSVLTMVKIESLMNADGSVSIYGFIIKSILAAILYYVFTKYS